MNDLTTADIEYIETASTLDLQKELDSLQANCTDIAYLRALAAEILRRRDRTRA